MQFLTTTDGVRELIEADSAQQAAQIAERDSDGAAQVLCLRGDNWPFPTSVNRERVPSAVIVGEALL